MPTRKCFFLWFFPYSNIHKCICKWIVQKDCENNSFLVLLTFIRLARLLSEEPYCPLKVRLPLFSHPSRCDQNLPPPCFLSIQFNTKTNTHRQTLFSHPSRWIATKTYHHHAFFQFHKYWFYQFQEYVHHAFVQFQVPDLSSSGSSWAGLQVAIWYVLNIAKKNCGGDKITKTFASRNSEDFETLRLFLNHT